LVTIAAVSVTCMKAPSCSSARKAKAGPAETGNVATIAAMKGRERSAMIEAETTIVAAVAIFRTRRRSVEAVTNGTRGAEGETELAVASGQTFVAPGRSFSRLNSQEHQNNLE